MLFATTYPDRVSALVLSATVPKFVASSDYPWGIGPEQFEQYLSLVAQAWGESATIKPLLPDLADDDPYPEWLTLRAHRVHHCTQVIHPHFEWGKVIERHAIGKATPPLVEAAISRPPWMFATASEAASDSCTDTSDSSIG
jgi:pimeloyl-ACP methyl ester carboxylesterase